MFKCNKIRVQSKFLMKVYNPYAVLQIRKITQISVFLLLTKFIFCPVKLFPKDSFKDP